MTALLARCRFRALFRSQIGSTDYCMMRDTTRYINFILSFAPFDSECAADTHAICTHMQLAEANTHASYNNTHVNLMLDSYNCFAHVVVSLQST